MAFHVVWEFRVRPGREEEFERRCGATGDAAAYRAFKEQHAEAYAALDLECAALTEEERRLGEFEPL